MTVDETAQTSSPGPMLIYDTNVLYAATGVSPNDKFDETRLEGYTKAVSTPTLLEVVAHFRTDAVALRRCTSTVLTRRYELVKVTEAEIRHDELRRLQQRETSTPYIDTCEAAVARKIRIEAALLRIFFLVLVTALLDALSKTPGVVASQTSRASLGNRFRSLVGGNTDRVLELFAEALRASYDEGGSKADQAVRAIMREQLDAHVHIFVGQSKIASRVHEGVDWKQAVAHYTALVRANPEQAVTSSRRANDPMRPARAGQFREANEALTVAVATELHELGLTASGARYLQARLTQIFRDGHVLRKNDTMDLMVACALDAADANIVTLDTQFSRTLELAHPRSHAFNVAHGFVDG